MILPNSESSIWTWSLIAIAEELFAIFIQIAKNDVKSEVVFCVWLDSLKFITERGVSTPNPPQYVNRVLYNMKRKSRGTLPTKSDTDTGVCPLLISRKFHTHAVGFSILNYSTFLSLGIWAWAWFIYSFKDTVYAGVMEPGSN